jgi:hypothetical protein
MAGVLDTILIKQLITAPTAVNSDFTSEVVDLTFREDAWSVQVDYENGIGVDIIVYIEYSNDGVTYARDEDSEIPLTTSDDTVVYDLGDTGVAYMRVGIQVNSGSIDLTQINVKMRRRH